MGRSAIRGWDPEPEPAEPEPEQATVEPPKPSDPKADWVEHAVAVGIPPDEAAAKTKTELIEQVGDLPAAIPADQPPEPSAA